MSDGPLTTPIERVRGLADALAAKAPTANPTFTGTTTMAAANVSGGINAQSVNLTGPVGTNPSYVNDIRVQGDSAGFGNYGFGLTSTYAIWWTGGSFYHAPLVGLAYDAPGVLRVTGNGGGLGSLNLSSGMFSGNVSAGRVVLGTDNYTNRATKPAQVDIAQTGSGALLALRSQQRQVGPFANLLEFYNSDGALGTYFDYNGTFYTGAYAFNGGAVLSSPNGDGSLRFYSSGAHGGSSLYIGDGAVIVGYAAPNSLIVNGPATASKYIGEQIKVGGVTVDGGGSVIGTGLKGPWIVPADCTITALYVDADVSTSCTVAITVNGTTVSASDSLTLTAASSGSKTSFTGWTLTLSKGDRVRASLSTNTSATRLTVTMLGVTR